MGLNYSANAPSPLLMIFTSMKHLYHFNITSPGSLLMCAASIYFLGNRGSNRWGPLTSWLIGNSEEMLEKVEND